MQQACTCACDKRLYNGALGKGPGRKESYGKSPTERVPQDNRVQQDRKERV
jgi:hypothetical protein